MGVLEDTSTALPFQPERKFSPMNTASPFILHTPGQRDPVNCLRSFLVKIRALAMGRGDHGSALEHNVLGLFVGREVVLRSTASRIAGLINGRLVETRAKFTAALSDGVVTAGERRAIEKRLARIEADARTLSNELVVPEEGS